jgi:hypothetical protein
MPASIVFGLRGVASTPLERLRNSVSQLWLPCMRGAENTSYRAWRR